MNDKIYVKDLFKKSKWTRVKEEVSYKFKQVSCWIYNNRDMIMVIGPLVIGSLTAIIKFTGKHINLKKEQQNKDLYCYDRSLGHYWKLRRELTNHEWIEIDKRKANGERLADILDELKVLK